MYIPGHEDKTVMPLLQDLWSCYTWVFKCVSHNINDSCDSCTALVIKVWFSTICMFLNICVWLCPTSGCIFVSFKVHFLSCFFSFMDDFPSSCHLFFYHTFYSHLQFHTSSLSRFSWAFTLLLMFFSPPSSFLMSSLCVFLSFRFLFNIILIFPTPFAHLSLSRSLSEPVENCKQRVTTRTTISLVLQFSSLSCLLLHTFLYFVHYIVLTYLFSFPLCWCRFSTFHVIIIIILFWAWKHLVRFFDSIVLYIFWINLPSMAWQLCVGFFESMVIHIPPRFRGCSLSHFFLTAHFFSSLLFKPALFFSFLFSPHFLGEPYGIGVLYLLCLATFRPYILTKWVGRVSSGSIFTTLGTTHHLGEKELILNDDNTLDITCSAVLPQRMGGQGSSGSYGHCNKGPWCNSQIYIHYRTY